MLRSFNCTTQNMVFLQIVNVEPSHIHLNLAVIHSNESVIHYRYRENKKLQLTISGPLKYENLTPRNFSRQHPITKYLLNNVDNIYMNSISEKVTLILSLIFLFFISSRCYKILPLHFSTLRFFSQ